MPSYEINYETLSIPKLIKGYEDGSIQGSRRDPDYLALLLSELEAPLFGAAYWELQDTGASKNSLPYLVVQKYDPTFGEDEAQTTGDCVSHSTRNSGMLDYCVDASLGTTTFNGRFATENIYGHRGHSGQGASCSRLANYVRSVGGFLIRKAYSKGSRSVDLSIYNSRIGHNWGRSGTPEWLNDIAQSEGYPAQNISLISQLEEARDAIANGYGVSVCSGYSFSNKRTKFGIAKRTSQGWAHAMAWIGFIDNPEDPAYKYNKGPLVLVQNSWGIWNSGPKYLNQPGGSFWISYKDAIGMLRSRGAWIISNIKPRRREINYDVLTIAT